MTKPTDHGATPMPDQPQPFQIDPQALLEACQNKVSELTQENLQLSAALRQLFTQAEAAEEELVRLRTQLGEDAVEQDASDAEPE